MRFCLSRIIFVCFVVCFFQPQSQAESNFTNWVKSFFVDDHETVKVPDSWVLTEAIEVKLTVDDVNAENIFVVDIMVERDSAVTVGLLEKDFAISFVPRWTEGSDLEWKIHEWNYQELVLGDSTNLVRPWSKAISLFGLGDTDVVYTLEVTRHPYSVYQFQKPFSQASETKEGLVRLITRGGENCPLSHVGWFVASRRLKFHQGWGCEIHRVP